MSMAEH
jgi:hypothetical protein